MKSDLNKIIVYFILFLGCMLSLSCGDQAGSNNETIGGNSSIAFRIAPPGSGKGMLTRAAAFDCDELGISSVSAMVYDSNDELLMTGGPWDCDLGEGIIRNVPSGRIARVVIICHDEANHMLYRGESLDILLETDQIADVGTINTYEFVPHLLSLISGTTVVESPVRLAWQDVVFASEYQVRVSVSDDFSDSDIVINQIVSGTSFLISEGTLAAGTQYYWEVYAIDEFGNAGAGSTIWSFSTRAYIPAGANNPPLVSIDRPLDNASFDEGDSVSFEATANDPEEGVLSGNSLVWTSSIDGSIGTGSSFDTSTLSVGEHTITLRATDSDGAFQISLISIIVNNPYQNSAPIAQILTPDDSDVFSYKDQIAFSGIATDEEDGPLSGESLSWHSTIDGSFGVDESFTASSLSMGTHNITLTASDSEGSTGSDSIAITIQNTPPTATIIQPGSTYTSYYIGENISFQGIGQDAEDGQLSGGSLIWTSNLDGQIRTGNYFTTNSLSAGIHLITFQVKDSHGASQTDTVSVVISYPPPVNPPVNQTPTAQIVSPNDNSNSVFGDPITFSGTGTDPEDGMLSGGSLVWTSSKDGQIGTGSSFTTDLSRGTHTITLSVTDSQGASQAATISVMINPYIQILAPGDNAVFNYNDQITYSGIATDAAGRILSGESLSWYSSIYGYFGYSESYTTSSLPAGTHTITFIAWGNDDNEDSNLSDSITIVIQNTPPMATLIQPENRSSFNVGDNISFEGTGLDAEDGELTGASLIWISDIDGQFEETGTSFKTNALSMGIHTITLQVTDSQGAIDTKTVSITIIPIEWNYYTSNPEANGESPEGKCSPGNTEEGTLRIELSGGNFTLTKDNQTEYSGSVNGNHYSCSYSFSDDPYTYVKTISFDLINSTEATGTITTQSTWNYGEVIYTCIKVSDITIYK